MAAKNAKDTKSEPVLFRGQTYTVKAEIDQLRAVVAIGLDEANRGLSEPWDADEIAAEVERRISVER